MRLFVNGYEIYGSFLLFKHVYNVDKYNEGNFDKLIYY